MFKYMEELNFIKPQIMEGAKLLKKAFDVNEKAARDVVTSNDLAIEELLTKAIEAKYPEDVIIAEETSQSLQEGYRAWVIDPIDGTTNYSRGIPMYGIQLAFLVDQVTVFSVIYYVVMEELYIAIKDHGAYCNDQPIKVGTNTSIDKAIITLGDFSTSHELRNSRMLNLIREMMDRAYKLRIHSTACIDLLFLASGKTDLHIMSANHPWDYLPGLLLVKEAGGVVEETLLTSLGDKRTLMIVASTEALFEAVRPYI